MLIVLGDHGMSDTGNHGGNHYKETDTVLFAYYSKGFHSTNNIFHN